MNALNSCDVFELTLTPQWRVNNYFKNRKIKCDKNNCWRDVTWLSLTDVVILMQTPEATVQEVRDIVRVDRIGLGCFIPSFYLNLTSSLSTNHYLPSLLASHGQEHTTTSAALALTMRLNRAR